MINASSNSLSRDRIRQLLAAIGSGPMKDVEQIEVTEYDWNQPHCFSLSQLKNLNNFAQKIAEVISGKFAKLYHCNFNVIVSSIAQHYAGGLIDKVLSGGKDNYYLAFGSEPQGMFGFVSVSEQTAQVWAKELLGDTAEGNDKKTGNSQGNNDEPLSQLEESLLFDIISAVVESLAVSLRQVSSSYNAQPAEAVVRGRLPFELNGTEEMCVIVFSIEKAVSDAEKKSTEVSFIIPCDKLSHHWSVVGQSVEADNKLSKDDISKAILEHLQSMPVTVTACLGATMLTCEQIMDLSPSDILLLDKAINEPFELIVEGRAVLRGQPAQSSGCQAAVITELLEKTLHKVQS
jgi:flagellar motor switch protein FliM